MRKYSSGERDEEERNPLAGQQFELDGQTFRYAGRLRFLDLSELARAAVAGADTTDPRGAASTAEFLALAMGEAEYQRFLRHTREHDTPDEVVIQILRDLNELMETSVEEETGRPTPPSPRSQPGQPETARMPTRVISLQRGDVQIIGEEPTRPQPQDHKPPRQRRKTG